MLRGGRGEAVDAVAVFMVVPEGAAIPAVEEVGDAMPIRPAEGVSWAVEMGWGAENCVGERGCDEDVVVAGAAGADWKSANSSSSSPPVRSAVAGCLPAATDDVDGAGIAAGAATGSSSPKSNRS